MSVIEFITVTGYTITVFMLGYMIGDRRKNDRPSSKR